MTQNVELDISTMEMTIDGEKVTGKCRSEPNYGLNEDLDDRSIRVGMYFHYNLSKSAEEQSVIIDIIQDIINDENIPYIFKLYNIDCHMHSISAHYISVHQKFINKQQPC